MNEWGFAAEVKSWWDGEFARQPQWRFARCEVEKRVIGGQERSDLSVLGGGQVWLSGELRLPDHAIASPWHPDNLSDAIHKATTHGARWAFTSDGTILLLIDCSRSGPPIARVVDRIKLTEFISRTELDSETFLSQVSASWLTALDRIAPVVSGLVSPPGMAPDELFINSLRAVLAAPVVATREAINARRATDHAFSDRLVEWMVDEQGWTHVPERWEAEVLRVAQLTTYVFATRLLFYEALRRARPTLSSLSVPLAGAGVARATLQAFFDEARERSGDYQTLFTWDLANELALAEDNCVAPWHRVIAHLAVFDLSAISFDVVGKMFERLIDPHERYEWGQHYTNPDVVDLMLSMAIPDGRGIVLDPAAGGGTFLVRAYERKRRLLENATHQDLLTQLVGLDVSAFAATLSTVNLAIRNLEFADNFPRVAIKSFFQVQPETVLMQLPVPTAAGLGGTASTMPVEIKRVRAVTCNPPYVRVHELGQARRDEVERSLRTGRKTIPVPQKLSGLANYHVYFWLHAAQFLEDGGRLTFITSGEWLDSDYGAPLQEWLLDHIVVECVVESGAEPWFSEARVGTVVVSARLCDDRHERDSNLTRFVLLRQTLQELYGRHEDDGTRLAAVDALRDRLLGLPGPWGESDEYDWSVASQSELRQLGLRRTESRP